MHPILVTLGTTPFWSHAVFVAAGVAIALAMTWRVARVRRRATQELLWVIAGGLVGGAIFAKYGLLVRYVQDAVDPSMMGFLSYGGRSLLGGMAGAYAGVVLTKRLVGYAGHTGDLLVPGVALGIAVGRIGCHLAEMPGTVTTLPWGVHVPATFADRLRDCIACRSGAAMHPSFLYESLFLLLAAVWLYPRARGATYPAAWMRDGDLFKCFLLAYAIFRFLVEFVRGNPVMLWGLSGSQLTVLPAIVLLILYFSRSAGRNGATRPVETLRVPAR